MKFCWAQSLGNCGGGFSGEHAVSEGIFDSKVISILAPWTEGELKSVGLKGLKRNILCKKHNNQLSQVDAEGIRMWRAIREINRENGIVQKQKTTIWNPKTHKINGPLLERWFLKTSINLFVQTKKLYLWPDGSDPRSPPLDFVKWAFGHESVKAPRGLYNWTGTEVGQRIVLADGEIEIIPMIKDEKYFAGFYFRFQGLRFAIWLLEQPFPWQNIRQYHHHMGGQFNVSDGRKTHELKIEW